MGTVVATFILKASEYTEHLSNNSITICKLLQHISKGDNLQTGISTNMETTLVGKTFTHSKVFPLRVVTSEKKRELFPPVISLGDVSFCQKK